MRLGMRFYEFIGVVHVILALTCGIGAVGLFYVAKEQIIAQTEQRVDAQWIVQFTPEQLSNVKTM